MQLKSIHVRMFRNIIDSGEIPVEQITCLVGKNESGKSAILQALHHLNPAKPMVTLDTLDEYPRWLYKEHQLNGQVDSARPITATFSLDDSEITELESEFGTGIFPSKSFEAFRTYKTRSLETEIKILYKEYVVSFLESYSARLKKYVDGVKTTSELITKLDQLISSTVSTTITANLINEGKAAKAKLSEALNGEPNLSQAVSKFLIDRIPKTFYFSAYSQLAGRYPLNEVFAAMDNPSSDESTEAAADFLRLARISTVTAGAWDFESANAELEAVSSLLTKRVKEHWHQNDHLKLAVKIEDQQKIISGQPIIERFLQFRVEDTRHDFSSRLDRRSTGFQWFVSFLASFLEFETDDNLILLLDEPGLSLHARAQMDLLDMIETKLAISRQVLYSTHSPFLVKVNRLNQVRIVEDQGAQIGSVVISDAGTVSDPDTLFPLQAALGYDIAQSIFVGDQNILVEGISDFIYLTMISEYLGKNGKSALTESARVLPAGGATNIPTFIALLGGKLQMVVLIDGGTDTQRIENSITNGRLDSPRVISLSKFCSVVKPDIEDLFEPEEYLKLFNGCFSKSLTLEDLTGSDRIVARLNRAIGFEFNHGKVAAHFLRNVDEAIGALSSVTLDKFEAVIVALNSALSEV